MATETEIKIRVADLADIRPRLGALGARPLGMRRELNAFFDTDDRALKLRGDGLRLRQMTRETGEASTVITFKGPRDAGEISSREEIEFAVGSFDNAALLLARLGYRQQLSFEKRRETWELNDCLVELDELPRLGTFVEIEGQDVNAIQEIRRQLGLGEEPIVSKGYASMVDKLLGEDPSLGRSLRFDASR